MYIKLQIQTNHDRKSSARWPPTVIGRFAFSYSNKTVSHTLYRWLSAILQFLQCVSNGDIAVLHKAYTSPSHYLNQCWFIVNWTLRNKLQWNFIKIQNFSFRKMHLKISSVKLRPFCSGRDELRGPSQLGLTRSISWLLMPLLLESPGHQQPSYRLCRIGRSLSYSRRNFNYLCLVSVEEWHKM